MLRFLRHIRLRMIDTRQLNKYFLYAIGEIILVVIGILIALQINTWNEEKKNLRLEQEYYCRLLEDIHQDREQFSEIRDQAKQRLKEANEAARQMQSNEPSLISVGQHILGATKAIYIDFNPNDAAFDDLKSGSNLNIIRDKDIIKALSRYYNRIDELKSIIKINGELAVELRFAKFDGFKTGLIQATIKNGQEATGLDPDVYAAISLEEDRVMPPDLRERMYHDALMYALLNSRQLELYDHMIMEVDHMQLFLEKKCPK